MTDLEDYYSSNSIAILREDPDLPMYKERCPKRKICFVTQQEIFSDLHLDVPSKEESDEYYALFNNKEVELYDPFDLPTIRVFDIQSPEVRNLSREIRKLHTTELKARLRSLGANTNGPKDLRQDRLLRAVLWCTGYQKSVPWYDWDNAKEEPTQSSENFTSRRNSKRKHEQTYGEETEKIRVTKMKSRSDYVDRGQDHENQDSSSKAKPQHQKEKVSKKKIRRLRGRVRSRNRDRSQSSSSSSSRSSSSSTRSSRSPSSSSSSSSSSSTSSNSSGRSSSSSSRSSRSLSSSSSSSSSSSTSSSSSSRSSRSPSSSSSSSSSSSTSSNSSGRSSSSSSRSSWSSISSRSNSRASLNSSSNSRSSSISSFDSRYLEPESDSAKKIAEPVIYSSPFEDCQVCGFKDVVFQSCPNCAELRVLLGNDLC
ncbi:uncharacterized protein DDB_G0271670-like [Nasonia vitripennis]|uniref:SAP domain-containing protein n=1 Tax=Nasonia vitripennis TaxID=7425 RepID=A0A7M7Q2R9_NASVI|nr:uncharacterized protein DDB_G0271670-like [Nasonia vitripennis]